MPDEAEQQRRRTEFDGDVVRAAEEFAHDAIAARRAAPPGSELHQFYSALLVDAVNLARFLEEDREANPLDPSRRVVRTGRKGVGKPWSMSEQDHRLADEIASLTGADEGVLLPGGADDTLLQPVEIDTAFGTADDVLAAAADALRPLADLRNELGRRTGEIPQDLVAPTAPQVISDDPSRTGRRGAVRPLAERVRSGEVSWNDDRFAAAADESMARARFAEHLRERRAPATMVQRLAAMVHRVHQREVNEVSEAIGNALLRRFGDWTPAGDVTAGNQVTHSSVVREQTRMFGAGVAGLLMTPRSERDLQPGGDRWGLFRALHRVALAAGYVPTDVAAEMGSRWRPFIHRSTGALAGERSRPYLTPLATAPPSEVVRRRYAALNPRSSTAVVNAIQQERPGLLRSPLALPRPAPQRPQVATPAGREAPAPAEDTGGIDPQIALTHELLTAPTREERAAIDHALLRTYDTGRAGVAPDRSWPSDYERKAEWVVRDPQTRRAIGVATVTDLGTDTTPGQVHLAIFPEHDGWGHETRVAAELARRVRDAGGALPAVVVDRRSGRETVDVTSLVETTRSAAAAPEAGVASTDTVASAPNADATPDVVTVTPPAQTTDSPAGAGREVGGGEGSVSAALGDAETRRREALLPDDVSRVDDDPPFVTAVEHDPLSEGIVPQADTPPLDAPGRTLGNSTGNVQRPSGRDPGSLA